MKRLAQYTLAFAFAVAGASQALAQGAVSGTVKFTGAAPANPKIDMTEEPICKAKYTGAVVDPVVTVNKGGLANVFISVKAGLPAGAKQRRDLRVRRSTDPQVCNLPLVDNRNRLVPNDR